MPRSETQTYIDTISAIAASPSVNWIVVGMTKQSANRKRAQFINPKLGFEHYVVLENNLSQEEAIELEYKIQEHIKTDAPRDSLCWRKYHPDKRDDVTRKSTDRAMVEEGDRSHSVFMVWWGGTE